MVIKNSWEAYKKYMLKNASADQCRVVRLAFYAGALTLFTTLVNHSSKQKDGQEDVSLMQEIDEELNLFVLEMKRKEEKCTPLN